MDILFELVLNFGFWIIILVGSLIYTSINRKDKKKKESKQNRKTISKMDTNEQSSTRDSTAYRKRKAGEQSRKDYLERLRNQYQQETSDSTSSSQNTDERIEREQNEKAARYEEKSKRKPKRRKALIENYYDTKPSEIETTQSFANNTTDNKKTVELPAMTAKKIRQAVIMKEILDKPKSLRNKAK